jgi:hypothetical protein
VIEIEQLPSRGKSFHPVVALRRADLGVAFVGSSNLSRSHPI